MLFVCVPDGARDLVDYLDPDAVRKFVELTYEKYYQTFPEHFGKTIDSAFYDEPTFHWVQGGRAWTPAFNRAFHREVSATVRHSTIRRCGTISDPTRPRRETRCSDCGPSCSPTDS